MTAATEAPQQEALAPARLLDVDLAEPVAAIPATDDAGTRYEQAWILVRIFAEPVALVTVSLNESGASRDDVLAALLDACGDTVRDRVAAAGGDVRSALAGQGTLTSTLPPFQARHERWAAAVEETTVVVCTRNRPMDLARALDSLAAQSLRTFRILVVDNAPDDDATRDLVAARAPAENICYTRELRPGLSFARNRALAEIETPLVAWLDDDETADQHWLAELVCAFAEAPEASAVSGAVIPGELRTRAQLWFEQYGGHSKGRGFTAAEFRRGQLDGQSPLYPLPPFGVGANMAFRTAALRALDGFDPALGAGTATKGGEDTLVFTQLLLAGATVLYRPSALTRHFHREGYDALREQMRGYGVGLTAFYASLLRTRPSLALPLLRLAPRAVLDTLGPSRARTHEVPADFPRELLGVKTRAMFTGPWAYLRARRAAARLLAVEEPASSQPAPRAPR